MSYCRFGEGDAYIYPSTEGGYTCGACILVGQSVRFSTAEQMLWHVREHEDAGHHIPVTAIEQLSEDAEIESLAPPEEPDHA